MGKENLQVVKGIDLQRYMGLWYEIASMPSFFQPKNDENTRATYSLNDDGTVHVLNETFTDGKKSSIEGTAYKADPKSDEAKLKVKFMVPPFLPIIPVYGNYWVLQLDEDYQWALIREPSLKYLWVTIFSPIYSSLVASIIYFLRKYLNSVNSILYLVTIYNSIFQLNI